MIPKSVKAKRPDKPEEWWKSREPWFDEKLRIMRKEPRFDTAAAAVKAAVAAAKGNPHDLDTWNLSIWEEPEELGSGYAIVHLDNRERAMICGYTEVVTSFRIADMVLGRDSVDEIDEV